MALSLILVNLILDLKNNNPITGLLTLEVNRIPPFIEFQITALSKSNVKNEITLLNVNNKKRKLSTLLY